MRWLLSARGILIWGELQEWKIKWSSWCAVTLKKSGETTWDDLDEITSSQIDEFKDSAQLSFTELDYHPVDTLLEVEGNPDPSIPSIKPITIEYILVEKFSDAFFSEIKKRLNGWDGLKFVLDEGVLLIRTAAVGKKSPYLETWKNEYFTSSTNLDCPLTRAGENYINPSRFILNFHSYPWIVMPPTFRRCSQCARNRIKLRRHNMELKLFPAKSPLKIVPIDLIRELIITSRSNQYILVITDLFINLLKKIPMKTYSVMEVSKHFLNYGPTVDVLSDKEGCFVSRIFQ